MSVPSPKRTKYNNEEEVKTASAAAIAPSLLTPPNVIVVSTGGHVTCLHVAPGTRLLSLPSLYFPSLGEIDLDSDLCELDEDLLVDNLPRYYFDRCGLPKGANIAMYNLVRDNNDVGGEHYDHIWCCMEPGEDEQEDEKRSFLKTPRMRPNILTKRRLLRPQDHDDDEGYSKFIRGPIFIIGRRVFGNTNIPLPEELINRVKETCKALLFLDSHFPITGTINLVDKNESDGGTDNILIHLISSNNDNDTHVDTVEASTCLLSYTTPPSSSGFATAFAFYAKLGDYIRGTHFNSAHFNSAMFRAFVEFLSIRHLSYSHAAYKAFADVYNCGSNYAITKPDDMENKVKLETLFASFRTHHFTMLADRTMTASSRCLVSPKGLHLSIPPITLF